MRYIATQITLNVEYQGMTILGYTKWSIRMLFRKMGYDISPIINHKDIQDFSESDLKMINSVKKYTLTSPERMYALIESVRYITKNTVPGDIVECGVWKGGSMMLAANTLVELDSTERDLYLFDTFAGTTKPTEIDKDSAGNSMLDIWNREFEGKKKLPGSADNASLEEVQKNMSLTKYPNDKIHFIKGNVEDTVPNKAPDKIAILRLDTDWYESTKHELEHMFPRLVKGGILIVDDYGHFQGSRIAVDKYFEENNIRSFLNRIDYTGRLIVKT